MREILLTSSVLIPVLLVLRHLFRETISRRLQYALWGLVLARLLIPVNLPAVEHNVLSVAEPVRQSVSAQLEDRKLYVLPTEQVELPAPEERAPELQPGYEMAVQSIGVMVVDDGGDTATVYAGWITAEEALHLVWYAGMAVMAAWFLLANLRFGAKLGRKQTEYSVEWCGYPVYLPVYLVETGLPSPCLFGLFRPAVYLTPAAVEDAATLRHVLAHETTHARHLDHLWGLLRCVCLVVYWFDPLVWVAAIVSRKDCELACDEGALQRLGEAERIPYGRTLLRLIPVAKRPDSPLLSATTMTAGKQELKDRITRIAEDRRTVGVALLAVVTAAALVCAATFTAAKPQPLTWEELDRYTTAFNSVEEGIYVRQFLTSHYETAEDIDLGALFYNFKVTEESAPRFSEENFTDEEVNTILFRFMDYTLSEDELYDLRTYNSRFYKDNGADGSTNDNGFIRFWAGERLGDDIALYYHAHTLHIRNGHYMMHAAEDGGEWGKVTLRPRRDGSFHIRANEPCERPDHLLEDVRPLSGQELDAFNSDDFRAAYGAFLNPLFTAPQNIDLFSLFYHSTALHETPDAAETEQARAEVGPYGTVVKLTTAAIDAFLVEHTGLTPVETTQDGLDDFAYLAEYDAYYLTVEDPGPRVVTFTDGTREGDIIRLYWQDFYYGGRGTECVTLLDRGDGQYWVISHLLTDNVAVATVYPEEDPWLTIPLDRLTPYEPKKMTPVRHTDDLVELGSSLDVRTGEGGHRYNVFCYRSTEDTICFGLCPGLYPPDTEAWAADVFFSLPISQNGVSLVMDGIPFDASVDLDIFQQEEFLGHDGFTITYPENGDAYSSHKRTDLYYLDEDGTPRLLAHVRGNYEGIDLDGDGEHELCAVSDTSAQLYLRRDEQFYEADIPSLLAEAWPEFESWGSSLWEHDCLTVTGSVKMPEWNESDSQSFTASASFTRYVYLGKDALLVYKPTEQTAVDHVLGTLDNIPDNVLAAAKATVLADYQAEKDSARNGSALPDDWRIESLTYVGRYDYTGGDIVIYNMNYEFHAGAPRKLIPTESSYITESGWYTNRLPYCTCLFFLEVYDQWTFLEARLIDYCSAPYMDITFDAEMDVWAEELGIYNEVDAEADALVTQLHNDPRAFIARLAELEEAEQRTLCRQLWAYQKGSGASDNGYVQTLYIQGIKNLHILQQTTTYSLNDREAAAFDILLQEAHSDEAAAQVQTILNALTAQGPIRLSHWYSLHSSDFTFTYEPTAEAVASFSDTFYWADTGVLPAALREHRPQLVLTSANEDITLTVFEYSDRIYCTYREQTYAFLAKNKIPDSFYEPFDYFCEWFDDARSDALPRLERDA